MSQYLFLRGAKQLLTLRGEPGVRRGLLSNNLEIIEDGSVLVKGSKIVSVGATRRLENLKEIRGCLEIPIHNCIVMPGFVDSSIESNLAAEPALSNSIQKRQKLSDFCTDSLSLLRSCLQHGTLTAGVRAGSRHSAKGADLSVLRQLTRIGKNPVSVKRIWSPQGSMADDWQTVHKFGLADSVSLKVGDPNLSFAAKSSMKINLDLATESTEHLREAIGRSSPGSVFCGHRLSGETRQVLAASKAIAVFKVGSQLSAESSCRVTRELIDEGGAIALASGYDFFNEPNFNMQMVLAVAVHQLRLSIEEAIVATTINAAYATHCGNEIGSIEPGKNADLLVMNVEDYRELPRRSGANNVAMVIRNGEIAINRTKWSVGAA